MNQIVVFWVLFGITAFALALAVQMRVVVAKVLRLSVAAKFAELSDADTRLAVRASPPGPVSGEASPQVMEVRNWIRDQHPGAVQHLGVARRWSRILPVLVVLVLAYGRFKLGAI